MRLFSLAFALTCLVTVLSSAEVPGTTWQALLNRSVVVTNTDATQVTGTLALVSADSISLILADGSVVTLAKGKVQGVRAVVTPAETAPTTAKVPLTAPPPPQPKPERASSGASLAMGIRDATVQYHSGWFLGGFLLGPIGVALSYTANPMPPAMPDSAKVDANSYVAGYQQEAKRKAEGSAWAGWGVEIAIVLIVAIASSSNSSTTTTTY